MLNRLLKADIHQERVEGAGVDELRTHESNRRSWSFRCSHIKLRHITLLAVIVLDAVVLIASPIELKTDSFFSTIVWPLALLIIGMGGLRLKLSDRLFRSMVGFSEIVIATIAVAAFCRLWIAIDRPYIDGALAEADKILGFSWLEIATVFTSSEAFKPVMIHAYVWLVLAMPVGAVGLFLCRKTDEAECFVSTFIFGIVFTAVVWSAFYSVGPFYYFRSIGMTFNIDVIHSEYAYKYISALRASNSGFLDFDDLHGLVGFPSFHATMAMLMLYGFCQFRYGVLLGLPWCVVALVATVVEGGHNVVDVMAGIVIAFTLFALCDRKQNMRLLLARLRPKRQPGPLSDLVQVRTAEANVAAGRNR